jgi:hypothetical protein
MMCGCANVRISVQASISSDHDQSAKFSSSWARDDKMRERRHLNGWMVLAQFRRADWPTKSQRAAVISSHHRPVLDSRICTTHTCAEVRMYICIRTTLSGVTTHTSVLFLAQRRGVTMPGKTWLGWKSSTRLNGRHTQPRHAHTQAVAVPHTPHWSDALLVVHEGQIAL